MCSLTYLIVRMLIQLIRINIHVLSVFGFMSILSIQICTEYSRLDGMNVDTVDTIIKYLQC